MPSEAERWRGEPALDRRIYIIEMGKRPTGEMAWTVTGPNGESYGGGVASPEHVWEIIATHIPALV